MQYATVIYENSLTGISHWKAAHIKYNFIHNLWFSWRLIMTKFAPFRNILKLCQTARFRHHMITSVACFPLSVKDQRVFFSLQANLQCTFTRISLSFIQSGSQKQVLIKVWCHSYVYAWFMVKLLMSSENWAGQFRSLRIWLRSRCKIFVKRRVVNKLTV